MTLHVVAPGVVVDTRNPGWDRPFMVERSEEGGGKRYFLCRFTAPNPDPTASPYSEFMLFGVVHVDAAGITEAWPIVVRKGQHVHVDLVADGDAELRWCLCPGCSRYVRWQTRSKARAPELVEVAYRCPQCGYVQYDVID